MTPPPNEAAAEVEGALRALVAQFDAYCQTGTSHYDAHNMLVRYPLWDAARKALTAYASRPANAPVEGLDLDAITHRDAWRAALLIAQTVARVSPPDIDDKAYWDHEIRAFDRTFAALAARASRPTPPDEDEEAYEVGKRDGYEEAVRRIDLLTGGDGEYRFCTDGDPERHTPDAAAMISRIVERFASRPTPEAEVKAVAGWQPIETAPHGRDFLALGPRGDMRRCWRHKPSSRTDEILTFARNQRFPATHWRALPRTIGDREDQGSSRADIAVSEGDTPAQSPAGGEG